MDTLDRQQRLAVARAADRLCHGRLSRRPSRRPSRRLSRRQFLRLCAKAGFGFTSLYFLGACGPAPAPTREAVIATAGPASASEPRTDQQRFLKEVGGAFAGTTLRIVGEDTPPSKATREIMQAEFIPLTGIEVEWEQLPLDRVLAKISADTARQAGRHDIFYWDQAWIGRFVDDAIDPRELLAKADLAYPDYDFDDFLSPLIEHIATYKDKLAAIPYDIPICIMMYRRDIFEELGPAVPSTMREYIEVVRAINDAKSPQVHGTVGQWCSGHYSLVKEALIWLWAHGGSVFRADEQSSIDDSRAAEAMAYMLELGRYMPAGVTTWDWSGQANSFAQGKAGIYISWGEFFPSFDNPEISKVVGLAEAAPCPREIALRTKADCGFDETPGISNQGGSSLAISRYSQNVEAAWIFLQWATSSDVTTRACLLGGGASPIRRSNYEDPRVKEKAHVTSGTTRHFDVTLDAILNRMGTEPHLPTWADLAVNSFAIELAKMTTGQQGIKTTLSNMAKAAEKAEVEGK